MKLKWEIFELELNMNAEQRKIIIQHMIQALNKAADNGANTEGQFGAAMDAVIRDITPDVIGKDPATGKYVSDKVPRAESFVSVPKELLRRCAEVVAYYGADCRIAEQLGHFLTTALGTQEGEAMDYDTALKELTDKFLAWNLPDSVCSDLCVTTSRWSMRHTTPRTGTNLLNADDARSMVGDVFGPHLWRVVQERERHRAASDANMRERCARVANKIGGWCKDALWREACEEVERHILTDDLEHSK